MILVHRTSNYEPKEALFAPLVTINDWFVLDILNNIYVKVHVPLPIQNSRIKERLKFPNVWLRYTMLVFEFIVGFGHMYLRFVLGTYSPLSYLFKLWMDAPLALRGCYVPNIR